MPIDPISQFAENQANVDFIFPEPRKFVRVIGRHIKANTQPGSLPTIYLSYDGVNFDMGSNYYNDGYSNWGGEPNPTYAVQPYHLGPPQSLNLGCRVGIDVGERPSLGQNFVADFISLGALPNGTPTGPMYECVGSVGFIGGLAGASPRPAHLGGGLWFANDPVNTPFDWNAQFKYGGHANNQAGQMIRGIRINMNGGGTFGRLVEHGLFMCEFPEFAPVAEPPPPPPPGLVFSPIGDFEAIPAALNGVTNKGAGAGAWKVGTTGWLGKTGSEPWAASTLTVYGSNNDGFVFGHPPTPFAQVTFNFYESDGIPAGPTDGVLVETKVITDTDAIPNVSFNVPAGNRLSRWVVMTHNQASTSMYVSAVVA